MEFAKDHYDLITPDGILQRVDTLADGRKQLWVRIQKISPRFKGYDLDPQRVFFNVKSTCAQLGIDARTMQIEFDRGRGTAEVLLEARAIGPIGQRLLELLRPGAALGKLFAADTRRIVRQPDYLTRMFGRVDRAGRPLLSLGGLHGGSDFVLGQLEGRAVAYLALKPGRVVYEEGVWDWLPTVERSLHFPKLRSRDFLQMYQRIDVSGSHRVVPDELLLVKTPPLHIRTVFAVVVDELLPRGVHHTHARVLDPTTFASGDIYELYGESSQDVHDIPLEFYTLEPYREHVFFQDRDQLQAALDDPATLQRAMETAPGGPQDRAAVFVVKGEQLRHLDPEEWVVTRPTFQEFPGLDFGERQAVLVEKWIDQQPATPFLKAIEEGWITSQGILLLRYFPSPYLKRLLISDLVQRSLKGIYFQYPSQGHRAFFSADDRALLSDLAKFAIPVFWVDPTSQQILKYVPRPGKDSGMFVPKPKVEEFIQATFFGIYGSNLLEGDFELELRRLLEGVQALKESAAHPLLHSAKPLAMVTGGGPGAMEVGNRVAVSLSMLSCANIVDFGAKGVVNEQQVNPFVEAKMTYRLDKLVERQAEFDLDFPIFLMGGIGTDFEFTLEQVRRKVGSTAMTPVLLFGPKDYWKDKITSCFRLNRATATIKGSEWVSNCFYSVQTAEQGLEVYRRFVSGSLSIGPKGPIYDLGFCDVASDLLQKTNH
jgi:predicted Rossmann-fold nucleotide-binding protein